MCQFRLAQSVPRLNHLHLRYCKKITDDGVNAITNSMTNIYSLDLSFCTRITAAAILNMFELRQDSLTELRLQNCSQLDITPDRRRLDFPGILGDGQAGRTILNALRSTDTMLSTLDLRSCGGQPSPSIGYRDEDVFVEGMHTLGFRQTLPGFFLASSPLECNDATKVSRPNVG
mmetsp:Transcript_32850/g.75631  ORF Transcript_32850/g.75631 Transcript_32850/m.75631 type:complete len:174 (-) Transcript_32850:1808-2329(-)